MAAQLAGLPAPALVVLDGEPEITSLAQQLWPTTPIQRCWWHLPHAPAQGLLRRRRRPPPRPPPETIPENCRIQREFGSVSLR